MAMPGTPMLVSVCSANFSNSTTAVLTRSGVTSVFGGVSSALAIVATRQTRSVQSDVFMTIANPCR